MPKFSAHSRCKLQEWNHSSIPNRLKDYEFSTLRQNHSDAFGEERQIGKAAVSFLNYKTHTEMMKHYNLNQQSAINSTYLN